MLLSIKYEHRYKKPHVAIYIYIIYLHSCPPKPCARRWYVHKAKCKYLNALEYRIKNDLYTIRHRPAWSSTRSLHRSDFHAHAQIPCIYTGQGLRRHRYSHQESKALLLWLTFCFFLVPWVSRCLQATNSSAAFSDCVSDTWAGANIYKNGSGTILSCHLLSTLLWQRAFWGMQWTGYRWLCFTAKLTFYPGHSHWLLC